MSSLPHKQTVTPFVSCRVLGVNFSRLYRVTQQSAMRILDFDQLTDITHQSQANSGHFEKIKPHNSRSVPLHTVNNYLTSNNIFETPTF